MCRCGSARFLPSCIIVWRTWSAWIAFVAWQRRKSSVLEVMANRSSAARVTRGHVQHMGLHSAREVWSVACVCVCDPSPSRREFSSVRRGARSLVWKCCSAWAIIKSVAALDAIIAIACQCLDPGKFSLVGCRHAPVVLAQLFRDASVFGCPPARVERKRGGYESGVAVFRASSARQGKGSKKRRGFGHVLILRARLRRW